MYRCISEIQSDWTFLLEKNVSFQLDIDVCITSSNEMLNLVLHSFKGPYVMQCYLGIWHKNMKNSKGYKTTASV